MTLKPYQKKTIDWLVDSRKKDPNFAGHIINFEPGLGKTRTAIETIKNLGLTHGLVVCPAVVRRTWEREFDKWWLDHPQIELLNTGKKAAEASLPISILSYGLLEKLAPKSLVEFIIFDEIHKLQTPSSLRSIHSKALVLQNLGAFRLGLTGTLMANNPGNAWCPIDTLWPGRVSTHFKFKDRYMLRDLESKAANLGYVKHYGVNPDLQDELKMRLDVMSTRVTVKDAQEWLPPFVPQLAYYDGSKADGHLKEAFKMVLNVLEQGETHGCILTYRKASARKLKEMADKSGKKAVLITGEKTPEKRIKDLLAIEKEEQGIVIATIDSTSTGINELQFCGVAVYAELVESLLTMIQSLKRFHRLSGQGRTLVYLLTNENNTVKGAEENTTERLVAKINAINSLVEAGAAEAGLQEVLGKMQKTFTPEELQEMLDVAGQTMDIDFDLNLDFE